MLSSMEIGIGAIAAFFVGFIWYGPLFGEKWQKASGVKCVKGEKPPGLNIMMSFVGWLAASSVLGWLVAVIPHATDKFQFGLAFVIWMAFVLPHEICGVLWGKRDWSLIWIDGGYSLAGMLAIATAFYLL